MNYEFLKVQIQETKDSIKHYSRKAAISKAMLYIDGVDKSYEKRQIGIYEVMITEKEDLLDIFFTARDLAKKT